MKVLDMDRDAWAANLTASAILATMLVGLAAGAELLFGARDHEPPAQKPE